MGCMHASLARASVATSTFLIVPFDGRSRPSHHSRDHRRNTRDHQSSGTGAQHTNSANESNIDRDGSFEPVGIRLLRDAAGAVIAGVNDAALMPLPNAFTELREQNFGLCFECSTFFQYSRPLESLVCTNCNSSFVQFMDSPSSLRWVVPGLRQDFTFEDQLDEVTNASLATTTRKCKKTRRSFLKTLRPTKCDSAGVSCSICYDQIDVDHQLVTLPCHHSYHSKCVLHWLSELSNTCPVCRAVFPEDMGSPFGDDPVTSFCDEDSDGAIKTKSVLSEPCMDVRAIARAESSRSSGRNPLRLGLSQTRATDRSRSLRSLSSFSLRRMLSRDGDTRPRLVTLPGMPCNPDCSRLPVAELTDSSESRSSDYFSEAVASKSAQRGQKPSQARPATSQSNSDVNCTPLPCPPALSSDQDGPPDLGRNECITAEVDDRANNDCSAQHENESACSAESVQERSSSSHLLYEEIPEDGGCMESSYVESTSTGSMAVDTSMRSMKAAYTGNEHMDTKSSSTARCSTNTGVSSFYGRSSSDFSVSVGSLRDNDTSGVDGGCVRPVPVRQFDESQKEDVSAHDGSLRDHNDAIFLASFAGAPCLVPGHIPS